MFGLKAPNLARCWDSAPEWDGHWKKICTCSTLLSSCFNRFGVFCSSYLLVFVFSFFLPHSLQTSLRYHTTMGILLSLFFCFHYLFFKLEVLVSDRLHNFSHSSKGRQLINLSGFTYHYNSNSLYHLVCSDTNTILKSLSHIPIHHQLLLFLFDT